MSKVVINADFGGFSISKKAAQFMAARGNKCAIAELADDPNDRFYGYGYSKEFPDGYIRHDPDLVAAVESLGEEANGSCASLKVVEIPDNIEYEIEDYDGAEHISEAHRKWW